MKTNDQVKKRQGLAKQGYFSHSRVNRQKRMNKNKKYYNKTLTKKE